MRASSTYKCQNDPVAQNTSKQRYVDKGWPTRDPDDHPVSELASDRVGPLSPFGDVTFPVPASTLPYLHPVTVVNR
ncbi:MAG: hypothetical protein H6521_13915 [Mycolicibacterium sp.]|nr:hypothetical protein [Mycobacterium sp.]MCB9410441.1 hypothetical protein [Mycolicibacterium sp.]